MNSQSICLTAVFTTLLLVSIGHATPLPQQFTAVYEVKKAGITIGETKRVLSRNDEHYQYESITDSLSTKSLVMSTKLSQEPIVASKLLFVAARLISPQIVQHWMAPDNLG